MSVTFHVEGQGSSCEDETTFVNLANENAADLLDWLHLPRQLWGAIEARELAARCRRRLWHVARNSDRERAPTIEGRFIHCGRRSGYLRERTAELLLLAERAGDGRIAWS